VEAPARLETEARIVSLEDTYFNDPEADSRSQPSFSRDSAEPLIDAPGASRGLDGNLSTRVAGQTLLANYGLGSKSRVAAPTRTVSATVLTDDAPASTRGLKSGQGFTNRLLTLAYSLTGRPYRAGGASPEAGFDNAGYVSYILSQSGVRLSDRNSRGALAAGKPVSRQDLRPGDVLVYQDPRVEGQYMLGVYTGNGNFLLASPRLNLVAETAAFGVDYGPYFIGGRRYVDDPAAAPLSEAAKMAATNGAVKQALSAMGDSLPSMASTYGSPKKKAKSYQRSKKPKRKVASSSARKAPKKKTSSKRKKRV
jgi:cell wall-associated NlpC family hydrolase